MALSSNSGFFLDMDTLTVGIKLAPAKIEAAVEATFKFYESQVENSAKLNAPWTDRTTNARNGLAARSGKEGGKHFIVLAHQVPYGIWLEVTHSAKNAIIMPTVEAFGPKVMGTLSNLLDRL